MSIRIGSARHDENGKLTGGRPGDHTGTEVSMQNFYVHKKGWYVLRPKTKDMADKLAESMITACNNDNIGYCQGHRLGIVKYGINSKVKTEADCGTTVRACIIHATGKDVGNFTTANEKSVLLSSGMFDDIGGYAAGMVLYNGDVIVTKTKGHTAIVTSGNPRKNVKDHLNPYPEPARILKKKFPCMRGDDVRWLQTELIYHGCLDEKDKKGNSNVDGILGNDTATGIGTFQKKVGITVDKKCGPVTREKLKE